MVPGAPTRRAVCGVPDSHPLLSLEGGGGDGSDVGTGPYRRVDERRSNARRNATVSSLRGRPMLERMTNADAPEPRPRRRAPAGAAVLREDVTEAIRAAVFEELAAVGYARMSIEGIAPPRGRRQDRGVPPLALQAARRPRRGLRARRPGPARAGHRLPGGRPAPALRGHLPRPAPPRRLADPPRPPGRGRPQPGHRRGRAEGAARGPGRSPRASSRRPRSAARSPPPWTTPWPWT